MLSRTSPIAHNWKEEQSYPFPFYEKPQSGADNGTDKLPSLIAKVEELSSEEGGAFQLLYSKKSS